MPNENDPQPTHEYLHEGKWYQAIVSEGSLMAYESTWQPLENFAAHCLKCKDFRFIMLRRFPLKEWDFTCPTCAPERWREVG